RRGNGKDAASAGDERVAIAGTPGEAARLKPSRSEESAAPKGERPRMPRVYRTARQALRPMSVADAAREVERRDGVVVFRDLETAAVSVLYRRRDGELTLVLAEA